MTNFKSYIKSVRAHGHHAFTMQDAVTQLGISHNAVRCGVYKLKKSGDIIRPAKNLYVIVPPEYQTIGSLPANELVPILMKHWGLRYYVCLLSAALYHGASHQKPQIFQVMVNKQLRSLFFGKIKIEFIYKKSLENAPIENIAVKTGYLAVATPELTAMDLLLYPHHAGGINHIATVLSELIETMNSEKLILLIDKSKKKSWVQRLGFILEHIESMEPKKQSEMIDLIYEHIADKPINTVPLAPELPTEGKPKNNRWMIIENTTIESDL